MADAKRSLPDNAEGNFFVDDTCINCGVSRHFAPDTFGDTGDFAFVTDQPATVEREIAAMRALLSCPVAAIGMGNTAGLRHARETLPLELAPDVYVCGFNHRVSFGSHSYLIRSQEGNWLVESPRFVKHLVRRIEELGGIRYIFLTHRDDVADAEKFASHFGAQRIIHDLERSAQPDAEIVLEGETFPALGEGQALFTPGHTEGHMVLVWKQRFLFTGDHLAWSPSEQRLRSTRRYCWYSWEEQISSMQSLRSLDRVEGVFPGHGMWHIMPRGEFPERIDEVVRWMRTVA